MSVEAGTTVYLVVTGYSDIEERSGGRYASRGAYRIRLIAQSNEPPTILAASYVKLADHYEMRITANDANHDLRRATFTLLDTNDEPINLGFDLDGDGAPDLATYVLTFPDIEGDTSSQAKTRSYFSPLVRSLEARGLAKAEVFVDDDFDARSETQVVELSTPMEQEIGASCTRDRTVDDCISFGVCDEETNRCVINADVEDVCNAATPIRITPPTTSTTEELVVGFLPTSPTGSLMASCRAVDVAELVYNVTVPGNVDLLATTDVPESSNIADTVLSIRSNCTDFRTEFDDPATPDVIDGCNDDANPATPHAALTLKDVGAGSYTIILEPYSDSGTPTTFGLKVSLRPVLDTGAACDPDEVQNRCRAGSCITGDGGYSCAAEE